MNLIHKNSNFKIHFIGIGGIGMSGIAELMFSNRSLGKKFGATMWGHGNFLISISEKIDLILNLF